MQGPRRDFKIMASRLGLFGHRFRLVGIPGHRPGPKITGDKFGYAQARKHLNRAFRGSQCLANSEAGEGPETPVDTIRNPNPFNSVCRFCSLGSPG